MGFRSTDESIQLKLLLLQRNTAPGFQDPSNTKVRARSSSWRKRAECFHVSHAHPPASSESSLRSLQYGYSVNAAQTVVRLSRWGSHDKKVCTCSVQTQLSAVGLTTQGMSATNNLFSPQMSLVCG